MRENRPIVLYRGLEDGSVEEVALPTRKEVCPQCRGHGTHVNRAIDGNGLSAEHFHDDPDFAEAYMRGDYDVTCELCGGANVIDVLDEERCSAAELLEYEQQEREYWADYASERRLRAMESGEY